MAMTIRQSRIVWGIRIVLALAFLAAGGAKLAGVAAMVEVFDKIGAGQGFRLVVGAIEIFGVALLLAPRTGLAGALWLGGTMVGAVATHLFVIGGSPLPAIVLGALCAFVAWRLWVEQGALIAPRA
jgi:hypothetical protein